MCVNRGTNANMSRLTELQNWLWINSSIIFQGYKIFTSCQIEVINQMHTTEVSTVQETEHIRNLTWGEGNFDLHYSFNVSKLVYLPSVM